MQDTKLKNVNRVDQSPLILAYLLLIVHRNCLIRFFIMQCFWELNIDRSVCNNVVFLM